MHQILNFFFRSGVKRSKKVKVNDEKVDWEMLPGVGQSVIKIILPEMKKAEVSIRTGRVLPYYTPVTVEGNIGEEIGRLQVKDGKIIEFEDPQEVLINEKLESGKLTANLTSNKDYHTVVTRTNGG